ncbi:MAG: PAS domain S-box protein [Bacteroidales bacterium]
MAGLKLNICFWYVDHTLIEEIIHLLKEGNYNPVYSNCRDIRLVLESIDKGDPDLIIADYDLPEVLRNKIEGTHSRSGFHIPLIYLVGERNEEKAAETLKRGVWDYLLKSHFVKLIPTVYSSQKYGKVLKLSRRVQNELEESREHFRNLSENSPDVIMRFDREYRHLYVNQTVFDQTGIPVKDFINRTHAEMGQFPEEKVLFWERAIDTVFDTKEKHTVEFDLETGQERIYLEWRLFPEFNEDGEVQTVLAIARNITDSKKANEAIRNSEEQLKLVIEATSLGYWDWSLKTNMVYFSPIYFKMLGYGPDEFPQKLETWHSLLHDDDREQAIAFINDFLLSKRRDFELEFRLICKSGAAKWISARGQIVEKNEDGSPRRLIGTHEDISERKRNELIQQTLFNISNAVNTTINLNELYEKIWENLGRIIDTTNCFLALYNEETKMLTMPFLRDKHDSFSEFPAGKTFTGYVVSTGKAQLIDPQLEKQLIAEGHVEPVGAPCVSWLGVPLKTNNKIIGVFAVQSYHEDVVFTDEDARILEFVSDQIALAIKRKRDQNNIIKSQEKQRRIFESSPDPIVVVNRDGLVIDYNTGLLRTMNITNEPLIGQSIFHFISKREWRKALRNFKQTWEERYLKNLEFQMKRADGSHFESEVSSGAIYDSDGMPESMVIMFKDITERKEAERDLLLAKDRAEESDRLKSAFLSNMSHEIRTPMNAIVGFSDLLNDPEISSESRSEYIAQINLGAENLMNLIDDIIDISKIEAGQIKIDKHDCHLHDLLKEQVTMFAQNLERVNKAHLDLRLNWKCSSERLTFNTDHFRVKQIVSNLLNNAIKFTDQGFVELGAEKKNSAMRIYVKDSGVGIVPEKEKVIFDRFMQGHQSKERIYGGTGLGLAISKNLVELLGGKMGVHSEHGAGSEFWFTLPWDEVKQPVIKRNDHPTSLLYDWKDKTILIAEDDDLNYSLVVESLKRTNIKIIRAKDGKETIELFDKHADRLDLVLMDIRMPEIDGYECTRIIKDKMPDMPVIAQTAYAMSGERVQSKQAGCNDHVSKPLNKEALIRKMNRFLK